ncbi:MAG TPA: hypothetical protein VKV17_02675 [Bryobacteraceae bacterium]|nr:hypothetical protein [Bryobacteraceae bacterium]
MFTWICPQCGREVPPSYTECPDCAAKGAVPPASAPAQPPANVPPGEPPQQPLYAPQNPGQPGQPQYAAYPPYPPPYPPPGQYPPGQYPQGQYPQYPPPQYQPPPPQYQPPPASPQYQAPRPAYAPPPTRKGLNALPTWLLTLVFALAFAGVVGGVYMLVGRGGSTAASPAVTADPAAAQAAVKTSPVQKYIEVSGIRFTQDQKRDILVKFTVTNHSDADLSGLAGTVQIFGRTQKSGEEPVGTFEFKTNVPPQASEEVTAPLATKLKVYELPDWQNVATNLRITSPL